MNTGAFTVQRYAGLFPFVIIAVLQKTGDIYRNAARLSYCLWHEPQQPQCAQSHPQDDFPFFLSRIIETMTAVKTAIRINETTMFPRFSASHAII